MANKQEFKGFDKFEQTREEGLRRLSYRESKLVHKCPYTALVEDFYARGCPIAAHILEHSIQKEEYQRAHHVIKKMCEDRVMLMQLFERACLAEISWRSAKNPAKQREALKIMYDLLVYIDGQDNDFRWLYKDCCMYFVKFFKTFQVEAADEILAKVLYRYGLNRIESEGTADKLTCEALTEALYFCEGKLWPSDVAVDNLYFYDLHTGVAIKMAEANCVYGSTLTDPKDWEEGLRLHSEAVKAIRKLNLHRARIKKIYYITYMAKVRYLIQINQAEEGVRLMAVFKAIFEEDMEQTSFKLIQAQAYELEGLCHIKLQHYNLGREALVKAMQISQVYDFPKLTASISLNLSILYCQTSNMPRAIHAIKKAREIYVGLKDKESVKKAGMTMAKFQVTSIFSEYLRLMKSKRYSAVTTLLEWNLKGKPFWDVNAKLILEDYLSVVNPEVEMPSHTRYQRKKAKKATYGFFAETVDQDDPEDNIQEILPKSYPQRYFRGDTAIAASCMQNNYCPRV